MHDNYKKLIVKIKITLILMLKILLPSASQIFSEFSFDP